MSWWKNLWRGRSPERDLDAELRFHLERQIQDLVDSGQSPEDARRRVRLDFGGLDQAKDACRDVRPLRWIEELGRDVKLGFRALGRERLFGASVTLILALGIGTSVAMFSVLQATVLRPLPYARPAELAILTTHTMVHDQPDGTSPPNLFDWRQQSASFAGMTFFRRTSVSQVTYQGADAPQRAQEGLVGPEFFELLGTPPLLGRTFSRTEFDGRERVVVLSEAVWQEQFGRSATIVGQTLLIDGQHHVVIGIMPRTFQLPTSDTRLWRPISILPSWQGLQRARDGDGIEVIGRLAAGAGLNEARAEMTLIAARLRDRYAENRNLDVRISSLFDHVVGRRTSRSVWLGFGAVLSLLAIACANAGGLLTARAAGRRRELAVRAALGAGTGRLTRQLLAESVSLWALSSVAGAALAYGLIELLLAYGPRSIPRLDQMRLDGTGLALAFLAGLVSVTACGTIPAFMAARADRSSAFNTRDGSSSRRHVLQDVLVSAQVAGALMLLIAAVLLARSFIRALGEDPGFPAGRIAIVRIERPRSETFFLDARARLERLPGVAAVGGIKDFFIRRNADQRVTVEGRPATSDALPRLTVDAVTPGYFRAMGIDLIEGRDFEDRDLANNAPPVYIVNEALAQRFWPGERAVGKRLVGGSSPPKDGNWSTVVGVVRDMRREGLDVAPILAGFIPDMLGNMDLTIRGEAGVTTLIPAIRQELRAIDPSLPIAITPAADRLSDRIGGRRFETQAIGLFAAIAVLLSAAGLYATLAYQVTLRTKEIGIRSALGASRRAIVAMVVGKGVVLAGAGAAAGLAGAASSARVMQSLLYETRATDAPSYLIAALVVLVVAALAAAGPGLRAAAVSPITALRQD